MFERVPARKKRQIGRKYFIPQFVLLLLAILLFCANSLAQTNSIPLTNFPARLGEDVWRVGYLAHPALSESSGLTASSYTNAFWTHSDDGIPFIFAVNRRGEHLAAFEVQGANLIDWEAISADGLGNLYLADIGTNGIARTHGAIHRVEEPDPFGQAGRVKVEQTWYFRYPNERYDAESFFVLNGYGYIITKQRLNGLVSMFRFLLGSSSESVLEFVANIAPGNDVGDAALSADRQRLALVTSEGVEIYFINGDPSSVLTAPMFETEYANSFMEGITFVPDGLLITSEEREVLLFDSEELGGAPIITEALEDATVFIGGTAEFSVEASGVPPLAYAWLFNGRLLRGETNESLVITNATLADAGLYEVIVSNAYGSARSSATLTVLERRFDLRITEVMSDPSAGAFAKADWWELTSFENETIDISGWSFLDNSDNLTNRFRIPDGTIIRPGESILFVEDLSPAQFLAWWGANNIPPGAQIITYSGFGFSNLGDELRLWSSESDDPGAVYASVTFGPADNGVSFGYNPETAIFGEPSVAGQNGAFRSVDRADVASPGRIRNPDVVPTTVDVRITEVMSSPGLILTVPKADWWELTSFDTNVVDLGGWSFDDGQDDTNGPFVIPGGIFISPGESIIFVEDLTPEQFRAWWGETNFPSGTQIITYSGGGLSFSSFGDSLRLWTTNTLEVYREVSFGPASPGVSFKYNPDTGAFGDPSVAGVHGAFVSTTGDDVGSPGRIRGEDQPPAEVDLRITEVMSSPALGGTKADWWELTSFSTNTIDLSGWSFDDGDDDTNGPFFIPPGVLISPGESIVFVEDLTPDQFRAWWGPNLSPARQVVTYSGGGLSFSSNGDGVRLWTTNRATVFREIRFGSAVSGVTFGYNPDTGTFGNLSAVGDEQGSFVSTTGNDIGSPGQIRGTVIVDTIDVRITEIMSSEETTTVPVADWWELTSFENSAVDLSGWMFNDSNGGFESAFTIPAGVTLQPGESIIFVEDLTSQEFLAWWGPANVEPGTQIVTYSGTNLSFSADGDSLRLWTNATTDTNLTIATVTFGAAQPGVSFAYNPTNRVLEPSRVGVNGAVRASAGPDVGSPGRITGATIELPDVRITEVMSSQAPLIPPNEDWWELTSFDNEPVDLSGWRFNDNEGDLETNAFVIPTGTVIQPGESIVFVENLTAEQFRSWWGPELPSTLRIITYSGSELSFGSAGDALRLWTTDTNSIFAQATFGQADIGISFGYDPTSQTFGEKSTNGVHGAFTAPTGDIGSPGRIQSVAGLRVQFTAESVIIRISEPGAAPLTIDYTDDLRGEWIPTEEILQGTNGASIQFQKPRESPMRFYRIRPL
jgi:hypothetical protein